MNAVRSWFLMMAVAFLTSAVIVHAYDVIMAWSVLVPGIFSAVFGFVWPRLFERRLRRPSCSTRRHVGSFAA